MIIKHHIKTYSICWLASSYDKETSTGIIENYYIPESVDELKEICVQLRNKEEEFRVIGHTSNIYFRPSTNFTNLISTRKLNKWQLDNNLLTCECGVNVKSLSRAMISEGFEGFAGMVDLPGTIGGGIYGNASVSNYSISQLLESVLILSEDGTVKELKKNDLKFQFRSSALKRHELRGVILSCVLHIKKGDKEREKKKAEYVSRWRKENQPGPLNNLGTTALLGKHTLYGLFTFTLAKICNIGRSSQKKTFVLKKFGMSHISPYLFGYNRFIWSNPNAHKVFDDYLKFINKAYKNTKLEIEVF